MVDWVIVENNHEPIISQELWDKCREVDASVSNGKCTKERVTKPLSGLCYCDSCGAKMHKADESDVDEYIRRLKSYAGAETLTRQMCVDLIEYITIDKYQGKKVPRDIHIYYKLIDKPLTDRKNALAK